MTSIAPNDFLAESRPARSFRGSELSNVSTWLAEPKSPSSAGTALYAIVMLPIAVATATVRSVTTRSLLAPLAAENAPRPADHCSSGGNAAISRPAQHGSVSECGHRRSPAASSDSGPGGATVWSTTWPSRRKTTRSAQDARCASWVTTTPATPRCVAARSRRMTASPFTESRAPVGSSASSKRRSPTMARAIATRWRSPPESSSG